MGSPDMKMTQSKAKTTDDFNPSQMSEEDALMWIKDLMNDDLHSENEANEDIDNGELDKKTTENEAPPSQKEERASSEKNESSKTSQDGSLSKEEKSKKESGKTERLILSPSKFVPPKALSATEARKLLIQAEDILVAATNTLNDARIIAQKAGLSVDSSILDSSYQSPFLPSKFVHGVSTAAPGESQTNSSISSLERIEKQKDLQQDDSNPMRGMLNAFPQILSTTGGHSNTDHMIQCTGDPVVDRIAEYKRRLKRRAKAMQPEEKGSDRWDQPRVAGSRRRRILREKDLPSAPPEPPLSGYVIFIAQMTTKVRHDRPHVHHNQIKVVREISKIWKYGMSNADREYYIEFAREAREEYKQQHREFRATGHFHPSKIFKKMEGGPWIRIAYHEKNALEREIATYDTVSFPPRPPDAETPHWVKKIELANERERQRRKKRQERRAAQQKNKPTPQK